MSEWIPADQLDQEEQWTSADKITPAGVPESELKATVPSYQPTDVFANARSQMRNQQRENLSTESKLANLPDYQKDLAKEYSWGQAGLMSAAKELHDLGLGVKSKYNFATGDTGNYQDAINTYQENQNLFKPMEKEHPIATTVGPMGLYAAPFMRFSPGMVNAFEGMGSKAFGSKLGNQFISSKPAQMFGLDNPAIGGYLNRATTSAARGTEGLMTGPWGQGILGAGEGALIGGIHPGMSPGEGALGGFAGGAGGSYLGRMLGKRGTMLTPEQKEINNTAKELGVKLEPGARTGDPRLQQIDAGLRTNMRSAGDIKSNQIRNDEIITSNIFNEAGIPHLGAGEKTTSAELLRNHFEKMGKQYDNFVSQTNHTSTPELTKEWSDIVSESSSALGLGTTPQGVIKVHPEIKRFIDRLNTAAGGDPYGNISGSEYKKLYSDMTNYVDKVKRSGGSDWKESTSAEAVEKMRDALESNMQRTIPADVAAEYKALNKKYAISKLLVKNKVIDPQTGDLDYIRLQDALRSGRNQQGFETMNPKSPFYNLNRIARLGAYTRKQPGASLATNQAMSRMLGPGMPGSFAASLLGGGAKLDYLRRPALGLYRFGYPHVTGYGGGLVSPKGMQWSGALGTGLGIEASQEENK